jgi:hypothetical protein
VGEEDTQIEITLTAKDVDSESFTHEVVSQPEFGRLEGTPPTLTYYPYLDFEGRDSFLIKANDGELNSDEFEVVIWMEPINDAPSFQLN